jgi:glycosyltransferase involved in cell wall biosynthesis
MMINKISIIIPAYNEESTISIIVDKLIKGTKENTSALHSLYV